MSADLTFNPNSYQTLTLMGRDGPLLVRVYEPVVYVTKPVDPAVQTLRLFVPEAYFMGESVNDYTSNSAPILLPNAVGGYLAAEPLYFDRVENDLVKDNQSLLAEALINGCVVAAVGVRGRDSKNPHGLPIGKAPAALVDLKAAVRFLRANQAVIPGNCERIIANGTSAGGALAALLGASGNHPYFEPFLIELGAATARDHIYAVSAFCPITNLDNADSAYEWQFNGVIKYKRITTELIDGKIKPKVEAGSLSESQALLSNELKGSFPDYLNSLSLTHNGLPLTLDVNGEGSFAQWITSKVIESAQGAVNSGVNLSRKQWLSLEGERVVGVDMEAFIAFMGRMKTPPAFDGVDLKNPENQLFGDGDAAHFTEFSLRHSMAETPQLAGLDQIAHFNPLSFISNTQALCDVCQYWRIRHGTRDNHTALAIPGVLALLLEKAGKTVDFKLAWDKPHVGDYDLPELFDWVYQLRA